MFRSIARVVLPVGMVFVSVLASLANAQISPNLPNPIAASNPLNHVTYSNFYTNVNSTQFGLPAAANTMRTMLLTLRLRF